ncbi:hypothetical protein, partial [Bordetella pertussis]|uniref:hypothetical protein n=1 Tax=Bordetella pertussis TaxID=520 RepID=UPI003212C8C9
MLATQAAGGQGGDGGAGSGSSGGGGDGGHGLAGAANDLRLHVAADSTCLWYTTDAADDSR